MGGFWRGLKQRKLVQWAIAYIAFAFALIQVLDVAAESYHWPDAFMHIAFGVLALGFVVALVLAWYHGERGAQRVSGPELLLIALALAIGGGLLWHFARTGTPVARGPVAAAASSPVQRNAESAARASTDSATGTTASAPQAIPAKSIAVLPFQNLSDDKKNEYFVEGMQDLILTKLADIGDLKVISRTSTAKYASHPDDLKTIGRQLGVATILEGSVQKAGNQVLVNVQLIDTRTDSHIWAQSYTRTLDNVFGVEGDVAQKIAAALKAKLSPAQHARMASVPTTNKAAYDAFLRAEYQANRGDTNYDTASMKAAIPLYRQAVQEDPDFALAWARLSYTESELAWFGGGGQSPKQLSRQAREDAEHALRLKPDLAAAHRAIGYSDYWGRGDYAAALAAFAAALKLNPNDADTLAARGYVERRQGRTDAAITSLGQAITLDPRNSALAFELGITYMQASRYDDAEGAFQRALALDPHNLNAMAANASVILYRTGDVVRALAAIHGDDPQLALYRVTLLTYQRKYKQALALLDGIPDTPDNFNAELNGSKSQQQADLYRLMGDMAHARALYAQSLAPLHATLKTTQGIMQAFVWASVADVRLGLGQTSAGLDAVARSLQVLGQHPDRSYGAELMEVAASSYARAQRPDLAVPLLDKALVEPGIGEYYAPVLLWLDPVWDPIRDDPGFQALLKKYAKYKPAVIYPTPPASVVATAPAS